MSIAIGDDEKDAQEIKLAKRQAHVIKQSQTWQAPESPEVLAQLEKFQDQKFGLMVHWGLYNLGGLKESWPLIDLDWTKWQYPPHTSWQEVKEMYLQLHKGFFPIRFDPEEWADIAANAGFKYLNMTTKHHDGFCMWDTATTNYKVTGPECPYRTQKHSDIVRSLYDAFRAKGMGISVYYSRADMSSPYYWEEGYLMKDGTRRLPSYDITEKPEQWAKFKSFVRAQLLELATKYGKIDSLWFDGGCDGYELGLDEITDEIRQIQPWVLSVIRSGTKGYVDHLTPELFVPDKPLNVPWETCTVMGKPYKEFGAQNVSFGYLYDQEYLSPAEIVKLLIDVVAKGGNLALNIAPQPDGRLPRNALLSLAVFGPWIQKFGDAIYGTRPIAPYRSGKLAFTQKQGAVNVFYLYEKEEAVPVQIDIPYNERVQGVTYMRTGEPLSFSHNGSELTVRLPESVAGAPGDLADVFVIHKS
ncbi:MAG: Alpha-L-fucosidase [Paenibacillus sp.]|jgi:alpha-L-fucosidase|nr:Alpha-L-fucosidase [Paenibacillus sp.]